MKNKNEVTGHLLLGCTVLRITREVPRGTSAGSRAVLPLPCLPLINMDATRRSLKVGHY